MIGTSDLEQEAFDLCKTVHESRRAGEVPQIDVGRLGEIGRAIFATGGFHGMVTSFDRIALMAPLNSDLMHAAESLIDANWSGIGNWGS